MERSLKRVLLEEQVGWCALYILLAFLEFSWVPSTTLISTLGLRLPRSVSSMGMSPLACDWAEPHDQ